MSASNSPFDISGPLDNGRWGSFRQSVAVMAAIAIMFDGMNSQLLGLAAPALSAEFGISKLALAQIIAAGMAGMAIGAIFGGVIGDRTGRRLASLVSIGAFGAGTIAMAWGQDLQSLMILRLFAGLGLGGLLPNATSLIAEFTPTRWRSATVMAAMTCVPLGGVLAATIAATQMETLGWRTLFAIAGLATLGLATLLLFILPESPRYLVQDAGRRQKLAALLGKLSIDTHGSSTFVDGHQPLVRVDAGILFRRGHLGDTLALCGAFFFFNLSSYSFLSWLPALLAQLGLNYTMLGITTALFNLGGIFGALAGAYAITRLGTRLPMLLLCATSVAGALLLMYSKNIVDFSPWVLAGSLALMSGALGIVQCALYPLAVHMFPPGVRATGVGAAAAVGRVGSLTSSFTAAIALDLGGAKLFFISVAVVLAIGGVCLFFIRRHGPPAPSGAASVPVGEALTEGNSTPA